MIITCPKCGQRGEIAAESRTSNDNESAIDFTPPEGFKKVQMWPQDAIYLYCVTCGVQAERGPGRLRLV